MRLNVRRCLMAALLAVPAIAGAIPIQSSTGNFVTFRDCTGPSGALCSTLGPIVQSTYGGEPGALTATASISSALYGTAISRTDLSGTDGEPILRLYAESEPGRRVSTNTFGLQRYTYTGLGPTTRSMSGVLEYSQSITDPNNPLYGTARSGIFADLLVFSTFDGFAEAGTTAQTNFDNLFNFAGGAALGYSLIGEQVYDDPNDAPSGSAPFNIIVNFNPGDSVWVYAFLQTPAADGSWVDSLNTFITAWDNTADLVPANVYRPVSVPEPGSLALLGLALGVLAVLAIMRRREFTAQRLKT